MKYTQKVVLSINLIHYLHIHPGTHRSEDLARRISESASSVSFCLVRLASNKLVGARKGPNGGYYRNSTDPPIFLYQILKAFGELKDFATSPTKGRARYLSQLLNEFFRSTEVIDAESLVPDSLNIVV